MVAIRHLVIALVNNVSGSDNVAGSQALQKLIYQAHQILQLVNVQMYLLMEFPIGSYRTNAFVTASIPFSWVQMAVVPILQLLM
jgi:hypothetical protein